jgi:tripartite-type tricarboxylate transporter receptor subunit TctC
MQRFSIPLLLVLTLLMAPPVMAQKYPEKNIRLVVSFPTGAPYVLALLLSDKLREPLGQTVVPDFRAGAGGNIASEIVARAPADGYTLLLASTAITITPSLYNNLGFDIFRDFAPVMMLATSPHVLVIHPSVPARTLKQLADVAKAHPGTLNYGSGGVGSSNQLGSELFKTLNKVEIVHVPYRGAAIAMTAMISGEVAMVTSTVPATIPLVKADRIRALAIMGPQRVASLPGVPTTAEAGMPDLIVMGWYGLLAPAGVRPEIIERLNTEIGKVMSFPETKSKLAQMELDASIGSPSEFGSFLRAEYERWHRVIKEANIKATD